MNNYDIYGDIAERTNGDIYVGVVGPVRTGKSTFVSKFMESLVLPNITEQNEKNGMIASNHSNNVIINVLLVILEKITGER